MKLSDDISDAVKRANNVRVSEDARDIRILTWDIESKPMLVYSWGLWNQNHGIDFIKDHGGMMCFAAKWAGVGEKIEFYSEFEHGHEAMVQKAHDLLDEADVVVSYNGDRYDTKRVNNEFLLQGLTPPRPFKSIDLIKTNKSRFDLPSRKLDYLVQRMGVGAKVHHEGFGLWLACMDGDPEAWKRMEEYNRGDVVVTERAYFRLLPWLTNSPHLGMFTRDEHSCPYCGKKALESDNEFTHTNVQSYRLLRCSNCEGWCRGTTRLQDATHTRTVR